MSSKTYQDKVNRLDREIADAEKKRATLNKQLADKNSKIANLNGTLRSATPSSVPSKLKQIASLQTEAARLQTKVAEVEKLIGKKREERNRANTQLQQELIKEQKNQQKENEKEQKKLSERYEKQIRQLKKSLDNSIRSQIQETNIYTQIEEDNTLYDVFISHASEDKESFVEEFVQELGNLGISVWYDKLEMKWGDSLRSKIDTGLKKSRFGVVVLSTFYISKGWTKYELEGLFNIEMTNGKIILPIWHNITKKQVQDFSPTLAGRFAMTTANMTPSEIASKLKELL